MRQASLNPQLRSCLILYNMSKCLAASRPVIVFFPLLQIPQWTNLQSWHTDYFRLLILLRSLAMLLWERGSWDLGRKTLPTWRKSSGTFLRSRKALVLTCTRTTRLSSHPKCKQQISSKRISNYLRINLISCPSIFPSLRYHSGPQDTMPT